MSAAKRILTNSLSGRHILLVSVCGKISRNTSFCRSAFPALSDLFQLETISRRWSTLLLGHSAAILPLLYPYSGRVSATHHLLSSMPAGHQRIARSSCNFSLIVLSFPSVLHENFLCAKRFSQEKTNNRYGL